MAVLQEKECLNRARAACLANIKTLNCWGSDLADISIVEKMVNLEVINISVNNVMTLKHFAFCPRIKEIYMRRNKVMSLEEVKYLKNLPQLKVVWLSDNPCADKDNYRNTILRNLPNLRKLDSTDVTTEELTLAQSEGDLITELEDLPAYNGLNLNQTLTMEMIECFTKRNTKSDENPGFEEKPKQEVQDEEEIPTSDKLEDSSNLQITSTEKFKETQEEVESNSDIKETKSNTLSAILLLLENLNEDELQEVKMQTEVLLEDKSVLVQKSVELE